MATVTNVALRPDGSPAAKAAVTVRLAGNGGAPLTGYLADDSGTLIAPVLTEANDDGEWSVELVANTLIEPEGSVYRVTERAPGHDDAVHYIDVPEADGPFALAELLSGPPGALDPIAGPRGPAGADGEDGGGTATVVHEQAVPASVWTIEHEWPGGYPSVTVVDSGGQEVEGDLVYVSTTELTVTFAGAFAGRAFLN